MNWRVISDYYHRNRGAVNGSIIGLILALAFLAFGFIKVLFIVFCMALGYYIGKKTGEDRYFIRRIFHEIKEKIFPPGA
ncbi:MAG TPA: DUF2273 domain-containing protein [Clostridiaceae bacterium]|nr:DUF2273 domain-containing protein [Clostridiaceae bacterium]